MRFKAPTIDEVKIRAAEIGLPEREAQKFFNHFESKGWRVGKDKMKVWKSALANWKLNWEDWGQRAPAGGARRFTPSGIPETRLQCGPEPELGA